MKSDDDDDNDRLFRSVLKTRSLCQTRMQLTLSARLFVGGYSDPPHLLDGPLM